MTLRARRASERLRHRRVRQPPSVKVPLALSLLAALVPLHDARVPRKQTSLPVQPSLMTCPAVTTVQTPTEAGARARIMLQGGSGLGLETALAPPAHRRMVTPQQGQTLTRALPARTVWRPYPPDGLRPTLPAQVQLAGQVVTLPTHLLRPALQGPFARAAVLAKATQDVHLKLARLMDLEGLLLPMEATPLLHA